MTAVRAAALLGLAALLGVQGSCTDGSCSDSLDEGNALLQVKDTATSEAWGCAREGQDPYWSHRSGHCCHSSSPLYKVKGRWHGRDCSYKCMKCSGEGEDIYRQCGSGCGGCHSGGASEIPCCPGYTAHYEYGRHVCRRDSFRNQCARAGQNPHDHRYNGRCCGGFVEVRGRWNSAHCTSQCESCTPNGGDVYRYCGSSCGGCYSGSQEHAPCCAGLHETWEHGKRICRGGGHWPWGSTINGTEVAEASQVDEPAEATKVGEASEVDEPAATV